MNRAPSDYPDGEAGKVLTVDLDVAKRAFEAMMPMRKIDIAAIEAALRA